jgi:hypothetical protein
MATIFPGSASVGQIFDGYEFNGTAWDIIGIDLTADYQPRVANISDTEIGYLNNASANIQTQLNSKQSTILVGSGLSFSSSTVGVNPGAMLNQIVDAVSGNSYGIVGTSAYLDVKDTNGYNKEIELDIAAVESQLVTDGFLKNSSASGTYLTQTSASSTYLTQVSASTTYQKKVDPVSITQSSNSANYPLTISSANEQGGGSGFSDIIKIINSKSGATNINKHFRMNSSGTLEIINSAYTASIFSVSDDGTVTSSNLGETGWSTVGSFSNSFVSGGNAPGYRRLNNVVYLRGNISSGTAGQTAFTLPSGYRPATDFVIPVQKFGTSDISYITVYTDGRVVPNSTAGWLTGIHFPVG